MGVCESKSVMAIWYKNAAPDTIYFHKIKLKRNIFLFLQNDILDQNGEWKN